ncbi:hypothetical protein [Candidatus Marimicrobium litorale]|uniref:Sulfotransferase family protein n=1 Tax=Candidatus Marimicrobium litorale TaxID=2518991 RepID=A0ABT3T4D5_9GAMM|nr:hypothetical protein [Candidatus Marimicrobium litorale]MCX2976685.1 hypothetical protein [Candidatus Marimicrobium litorale]
MARKSYACCIERQVRSELRWISKKDIGEKNYFGLMSLYPGLKRIFFVHIPKCGGTSIRQNLVESYGVAPIPLTSPGTIQQSVQFMVSSAYRRGVLKDIGSRDEVHQQDNSQRSTYLRVLVAFMVATNPRYLFILGHQRAKELAPLYRGAPDLIFSTVREPVAMLRSLVNYRVFHTLANQNRRDSQELLDLFNCTIEEFNVLLKSDPRVLVSKILSANKASLASYLALDDNTDPDAVWSGICNHGIYIAHVSEQNEFQKALFGKQPRALHKNATDTNVDFIESFNACLQDEWIRPHIDKDSAELYKRFVEKGIIGFWKNGGSPESYRRLLRDT